MNRVHPDDVKIVRAINLTPHQLFTLSSLNSLPARFLLRETFGDEIVYRTCIHGTLGCQAVGVHTEHCFPTVAP